MIQHDTDTKRTKVGTNASTLKLQRQETAQRAADAEETKAALSIAYNQEIAAAEKRAKEDKEIQESTPKPPSIENLVLAEKHGQSQLYDRYMAFTKATPLSKLKQQYGFSGLEPMTLFKILTHKAEQLELD